MSRGREERGGEAGRRDDHPPRRRGAGRRLDHDRLADPQRPRDRVSRSATETRARILAAAADLGYKPNLLARALRGSRSSLLGVIVRDIIGPVPHPGPARRQRGRPRPRLPALPRPCRLEPGRRGRSTARCSSSPTPTGSSSWATSRAATRPSTTSPTSTSTSSASATGSARGRVPGRLRRQRARHAPRPRAPLGARPPEHHLRRRRADGRRPATRPRSTSASCASTARPIASGSYFTTQPDPEPGYRLGRELFAHLDRPSRPTAVFAASDTIAIGLLQAAFQARVVVPDQLSIVGFDDIDIASFTIPPLTTISQSGVEMGRHRGRPAPRHDRGTSATTSRRHRRRAVASSSASRRRRRPLTYRGAVSDGGALRDPSPRGSCAPPTRPPRTVPIQTRRRRGRRDQFPIRRP